MTNNAEAVLKAMFDGASFPTPTTQKAIPLGIPLGTTTPDFFYEDPEQRFEGLCIYLDGLSAGIHGNPEVAKKDARLREELRARGYEVIEIAASHLTDKNQMERHFSIIARFLMGRDGARRVREDTSWYAASQPPPPTAPEDDGWEESLELVDDGWRPLLRGLREAGLPPPAEVMWEIALDGRVTDEFKVVAVWNPHDTWVGLVPSEHVDQVAHRGAVAVTPDANPAAVADDVREWIETTALPEAS